MGIKKDDQPNFTKQNLIDFIRNKIANISAFGTDAEAASKDLIEYYVERGSAEEKNNDRFYFIRYTDVCFTLILIVAKQKFFQLLSDIQFTIPTIRDGLEKSKLNWPTYTYLFDWTNPELIEEFGFYGGMLGDIVALPCFTCANILGANHGLELAYLHGPKIFKDFEFTDIDYQLQKVYVEGVANFFKNGFVFS